MDAWMMGPGNKDNPDQPCGMEGKNGQEQEAELERYWGILTPNTTMGGEIVFSTSPSNSQDNQPDTGSGHPTI